MNEQNQIDLALKRVAEGALVGLPTETVYGLAAPIDREDSIEKIFVLKERPFFDPLIVHVTGKDQAKDLVSQWPEVAELLAENFWPGPLTMVLEKNKKVSDLITAGLETVGLRAPRHPVAQEFLKKAKVPFAAPSANKFKKTSPTQASHVSEVFDEKDVFVLEGGSSEVGIESTIVKISSDKITLLRPGILSASEISRVVKPLGFSVEIFKGDSIVAPGQMKEHYRPEKPLHTVVAQSQTQAQEIFAQKGSLFLIELPDDPALAARILYIKLREVKTSQLEGCALWLKEQWLSDDKWMGIIDRVKKASTHFEFVQ